MKLHFSIPAAVLSLAAPVAPALAHAILMESTPTLDGQIAPGPRVITLRFNSLIDVKRSRVLLSVPTAQVSTLVLTGGGNGDTINAGVTVAPGHYVLHWQVLAIDGHITRGNVPFDVVPAGAGSIPGH